MSLFTIQIKKKKIKSGVSVHEYKINRGIPVHFF